METMLPKCCIQKKGYYPWSGQSHVTCDDPFQFIGLARAIACKIGKDLNYRPYIFEGGGETPAPSGLRSYPGFPPLSFRAALFFWSIPFYGISQTWSPPVTWADPESMPARKRGVWIFGNRCPCRRGFRVGFVFRALSFCQILTDFNLSGLSETARNDKVGSCGSTWHVGKIQPCDGPASSVYRSCLTRLNRIWKNLKIRFGS